MRRDATWRRYVRFWGPDVAADIDDEMECHIDLRTSELMREGMTRPQARARAVAEFGDMARAKGECRTIGEERVKRERRAEWWDTIRQDLMIASRGLRRNPGFTAVAVLALAVGIGANAAVFSIVDAAAFRPLPVSAPEQLVAIYGSDDGAALLNVPYPAYELLRAQRTAFADVATFTEKAVSVQSGAAARVVMSQLTSDNYFSMLGVRAARGRVFAEGELREPVVVLSDALWRGHFNGDADVVGSALELNGHTYTVIGVAPADFQGTRLLAWAPSLWVPAGMYDQLVPGSSEALQSYRGNGFTVVARLQPGVQLDAIQSVLAHTTEQVRAAGPPWLQNYSFTAVENRTPINPWFASSATIRAVSLMFIAGVALVLLIACADVANLLLARVTARRGEFALRRSLGAARSRLVRQLLTENLVLAALAGACAVPIAYGARYIVARLQPPTDHAVAFRAVVDERVLIFTALAALLAGVVAGIMPALRSARGDLGAVLRADTAGVTGRRSRLRDGLVVLQIAISIVVLTAAGMFQRNLHQARAVDPGFDVDNALVFTLQPQLLPAYDSARVETLYAELMQRLRIVPGVRAVTRTTSLPLDGSSSATLVFADGAAAADGIWTDLVVVDPGYHAVLGTRLLEGREFEVRDRGAPGSVVINRALAERLWPGESALGRRIRDGSAAGDVYEVIGVAATGKYTRLSEAAQPSIAFDLQRSPRSSTTILARVAGDPAVFYPHVHRIVRELDARLPVVGLKSLREHTSVAYAAAESGAFASAIFGALALLLAAAGIYGVISYAVAQRRREIGIRIALGASRVDVVRMVLRGGGVLALLGTAVGSMLALLMGFGLRGMMYDGSGHDPATLVGVCLLLGAVAMLASWLPARRAARIDPTLSMRA